MTSFYFGLIFAAVVFSLPGGLLAGFAGRKRWLWFWVVAALFLLLDITLFSAPGPKKKDDLLPTALLFGSATLVEGLAFRRAFRAVTRWWVSRSG